MDYPARQNPVGPADYLRPVWRFKWLVLVLVAAVTAGTYAYYDHKPRIYTSGATMYVGPSQTQAILNGTFNASGSGRALANQARLVASPEVAARVAQRLGLTNVPPIALLGAITVTPDTSSDFITVEATGQNPRLVAAVANGFARSYLDLQGEQQVKSLQAALSDAQAQLRDSKGRSSVATTGVLLPRINNLENQLANPDPAGQLVDSASVPAIPDSPKPKRNAIFGAALALVLGIIGAFLLDRADRRLRDATDLEEIYGAPVLATMPKVRRPTPVKNEIAAIPGDLQEPLRTLRVNLDIAAVDKPLRTLLITSAMPREGKSTTVRNLAFSYRDAGYRVIIVEADLRRPSLAKMLGLENGAGLAEVLLGQATVDDVLQAARTDTDLQLAAKPDTPEQDAPPEGLNGHRGAVPLTPVHVITAGSTLVDPTTVLTEERLEPLLKRLTEIADIVIVDSPPALAVGDVLQMLPLVGGLLLVAQVGVTTPDAARRLQRTLERVPGAAPIGIVVNAGQDDMAYGYAADRPSGATMSIGQ